MTYGMQGKRGENMRRNKKWVYISSVILLTIFFTAIFIVRTIMYKDKEPSVIVSDTVNNVTCQTKALENVYINATFKSDYTLDTCSNVSGKLELQNKGDYINWHYNLTPEYKEKISFKAISVIDNESLLLKENVAKKLLAITKLDSKYYLKVYDENLELLKELELNININDAAFYQIVLADNNYYILGYSNDDIGEPFITKVNYDITESIYTSLSKLVGEPVEKIFKMLKTDDGVFLIGNSVVINYDLNTNAILTKISDDNIYLDGIIGDNYYGIKYSMSGTIIAIYDKEGNKINEIPLENYDTCKEKMCYSDEIYVFNDNLIVATESKTLILKQDGTLVKEIDYSLPTDNFTCSPKVIDYIINDDNFYLVMTNKDCNVELKKYNSNLEEESIKTYQGFDLSFILGHQETIEVDDEGDKLSLYFTIEERINDTIIKYELEK